MERDFVEIGKIKVIFPIPYITIKNIHIEEKYNQHGKLSVTLLVKDGTSAFESESFSKVPITVTDEKDNIIFYGLVEYINRLQESEYRELEIIAYSQSKKTDEKRNSRTFQSESKTLQEIADTVMAEHGFSVEVGENIVISKMIQQNKETDWEFLKRVANQNGMLVFVDTKSAIPRISVGAVGFAQKELDETVEIVSSGKAIQDCINIRGNIDSDVSICDFEINTLKIRDVEIGTGYCVEGGKKIVTESILQSESGVLINKIKIRYKIGARTKISEELEDVISSTALSGKVLAVEGCKIKVHFEIDDSQSQEEARWIPYENGMNNYLYSMPDIGDTVFAYRDNETVIALGAKRQGDNDDFNKTEDKMLTSTNKMLRLNPQGIEMVGNRSEYDGGGGNQSKVVMSDEGIEIYSTNDINIGSKTKQIWLLVSQNTEEFKENLKTFKSKFEDAKKIGEDKYGSSKELQKEMDEEQSKSALDQMLSLPGYMGEKWVDGGKEFLDGIVDTGKTILGWISPDDEKPEGSNQKEFSDTGVIYISGMESLVAKVDNNAIEMNNKYLNFHSDLYMWLGFEKGKHEEESESQKDGLDWGLDGLQFVLDIVGTVADFFPPIGTAIAIVADVANAGISAARGDYFGASMSLLSAIPVVGDALGKGAKAAKAGTKAAKALETASKIMIKTEKVIDNAQDVMDIIERVEATVGFIDAVKDGIDLSDPNDKEAIFNFATNALQVIAGGVASGIKNRRNRTSNKGDGSSSKGDGSSNKGDGSSNKGDGSSNKGDGSSNKGDGSSNKGDGTSNKGDGSSNKTDNNKTNKEPSADSPKSESKAADPINVITGAMTIDYTDIVINDISGEFRFKRFYKSIHQNRNCLLGSVWTTNLDNWIFIKNDNATVMCDNLHEEKFIKEDGLWINKRNRDASYTLKETEKGYLFSDKKEQIKYEFDKTGKITSITDKNDNKIEFLYSLDKLKKVSFPSGQFMELTYEKGKVKTISDRLGWTVSYEYKGDLLATATYPNNGVITYDYDSQGYLREIVDQNGNRVVTNEYDRTGRVVRQKLDKKEYIILYDDANRRNTFVTIDTDSRVIYEYNKEKLLVNTIYDDGTSKAVSYDERENPVYVKDRLGNEIHRVYNEKSELIEEDMPNGLVNKFTFDESGNLLTYENNIGKKTIFSYDNNGNCLRETKEIGNGLLSEEIYTYDESGRMLSKKDAIGNITTYRYENNFSRPTQITNPDGVTFFYTYDEGGQNTTVTGELGTISYGYTSMGYKGEIVDAEGNTTRYLYDRMCNVVKRVDPNEIEVLNPRGTCYEYNKRDDLISITNPLLEVTAFHKNDDGLTIKEINPNSYNPHTKDGIGITYEYDTENRRTKIIYPNGGIERIFYDSNGNIIKKIKPLEYDETIDDGAGYTYEYDCVNRLTKITNPDGVVENSYVYYLDGKLKKVIDAKGYTLGKDNDERPGTIYTYNQAGWVIKKEEPVRIETIKQKTATTKEIKYRVTKYIYDKAGNVLSEKRYLHEQNKGEEAGSVRTITYTYDSCGRIIEIKDGLGAEIIYNYNGYNLRTFEKKKVSNGVYQIKNYEYDKAGRIKTILEGADKKGTGKTFTKTTFDYDKNSNLIQIITPTGNKILRTYDMADRLKTEEHIEKNGFIKNKITYEYDKAGNITAITNADNTTTTYSYDWLNRQIQKTGTAGDTQITLYDKNGNIVKQITPNEYEKIKDAIDNKTTTARINPESIKLENLRLNNIGLENTGLENFGYTYQYDKIGNLLTVTSPEQTLLREITYNPYGEIIKETTGNKNTTQLEYDLLGRRTKIITPKGSTQVYEYDIWGNVTAVEEGRSNRTAYKLDAWGRILSIKKPDEITEHYTYDESGNMTTATDGEGHTINYKYNCLNKLEEIIDQTGKSQIYLYDEEGRIKETIDRNENHTLYTYNMYGDLVSKRDRESNLQETYRYTQEGKLQSAISKGMRYDYIYDKAGRLHQKKASGRTLLSYEYDYNGNRTSQTDFTGKTVKYTYDLQDRLQMIQELDSENIISQNIDIDSQNTIQSSTHKNILEENINVQNKNITDTLNKTTKEIIEKVRQNTNKQLDSKLNKNTPEKERLKVTYEYNLDGTRKSQKIGNNLYTTYEYDKDMNMTRKATAIEDTYLEDNNYIYDNNGNCIEKTQKYGVSLIGTTTYSYDRQNQLELVQYPTYKEQFYYDKAGNRTARKTDTIEEIYKYDQRNRLIERTIKDITKRDVAIDSQSTNNTATTEHHNIIKDITLKTTNTKANAQPIQDIQNTVNSQAIGNASATPITSSRIIKYTYDEQGNLIKDEQATYSYDAFNRMTKVEKLDGNIQQNHYDAEGLRYEVQENERLLSFLYSGREVVAQTEEKDKTVTRYIRGNELIASDSEKARTYYHYVSDERGSTTHIVDSETNEIKNQYEYDAYGNLITRKETIENRFLYTGQQLDPLTNQYYLRARYYNPVIGRFTQEDTYYGDGLNLYTYCANNPIAYIDPNGHESISPKDKDTSSKPSQEQYNKYKECRDAGMTPAQAKAVAMDGYKQDVNGRWHDEKGRFTTDPQNRINASDNNNIKNKVRQPDASASQAARILAQNRVNGRTFEQQEFAKFSSQNNNAVEQITVKTSSGVRTRVDAIGLDSKGNVVINEYKSSSTAPLTKNQKIAFPEIFKDGATVVGKGKGIFSGGYQIPPGIKVIIIRPK